VVELIRLGIERDAIRADLVSRSPELVEKWTVPSPKHGAETSRRL
jgi:hypothetical protein